MSHHLTEFMQLKAGDVVRPKAKVKLAGAPHAPPIDQHVYAFSDHLILGFNDEGEAKLSRPYAYVSGSGTTGPRVLLGHEDYTMRGVHVTELFDVVASGHTT